MDYSTLLQILDSTLRLATPLLLACLAGLYSERSGVFDIGLEGKILVAAMCAGAVAFYTGNAWVGALAGIAGHLISKMRFVAAQMEAYLSVDHWLANARHANAMARRLAEGLAVAQGVELLYPAATNLLFVRMAAPVLQALQQQGFDFYHGGRWGPGVARLVTSWRTRVEDVDALVTAARQGPG